MTDLNIKLSQDSGKHLYDQIYGHIRDEIRKGKLLQGEKLPSTRSLADFLQISRSTAELAYSQLLSEGYIESRPCSGYYISCPDGLFWTDTDVNGRNGAKQNEGKEAGLEKYSCDFSPSAVDMSRFPFATWKKMTKNILVDANSEMFAMGMPKGDENLRETIAGYLYSSRGVDCSAEQIIVGAGNDYLLMLLEKILGKEKNIAMENPTYQRAYRIFHSFGYQVSFVETDGGGMSMEKLRRTQADTAYVMPAHQYPMGIVMPIGRRTELLKWAGEREDRYLIEDDYDSEFRFKGKPIPALKSLDGIGKVIYIGTFSKSIAPAIRISYMVLPLRLLEVYESRCYFYSSTVSRIDQKILNEFIQKGHFERYLNQMRKVYRTKHDILLQQVENLLPDFEISGENAGLHILLKDQRKRGEARLLEKAALAGVKVYGLSAATTNHPEIEKRETNTVILGYGAMSTEQIQEGIHLLCEAWNSLR